VLARSAAVYPLLMFIRISLDSLSVPPSPSPFPFSSAPLFSPEVLFLACCLHPDPNPISDPAQLLLPPFGGQRPSPSLSLRPLDPTLVLFSPSHQSRAAPGSDVFSAARSLAPPPAFSPQFQSITILADHRISQAANTILSLWLLLPLPLFFFFPSPSTG